MVHFLLILPQSDDLVVAAKVIARLLKEQVGDAEVSFVGDADWESKLQDLAPIVCVSWSDAEMRKKLSESYFDYVIDFESKWRSWRLKSWLGVLDFTIGESFWQNSFGFRKPPKPITSEELIDAALAKLSAFDIEDDGKRPEEL